MQVKQKISLIVAFQIVLIVTSFLILAHLESEGLELGNTINRAGLNRFLVLSVILETYHNENFLEDKQKTAVNTLEENILLIKNGGTADNQTVKKLPIELTENWNDVYDTFLNFKDEINQVRPNQENSVEIHKNIQVVGRNLIENSDKLVKEIAIFLEERNQLLIKLEVILLIVNTIVHVLLVILIFKILNRVTNEKINLERFAIIGQIGATIAHDVRNPLTVIKGSADLLKIKKEKTVEFENKQLDKIYTAVNKIEHLTKDILEFSKTKKIEKVKTSLLEIIKQSVAEIKAPENVQIKISERDYQLEVDKIRMQTVFTNLIKNAIEAIEEKGTIEIELEEKHDNILVTVKDSGKGINPKDISKIFDPLYTTKQTGTGLGLASSKRIIIEHGGRMELKVNPTMFMIFLPKN